jgi:hypothetical protein
MKTKKSLLVLLAIALAFALVFTACDNGGGGGGKTPSSGSTRDPVTYTGTAGGVTYTLKIEDGGARAVLTPAKDDKYTLTAGGKTSTGAVNSFTGGVLTLAPSKDSGKTFTATVSGAGITAMTGTITYDDGTTASAPSITPPSGGAKSITITGITGLTDDDYARVIVRPKDNSNNVVAGSKTVNITNGVILVDLYIWGSNTISNTNYTGSTSEYVVVAINEKDWYITKQKISINQATTTILWSNFEKWE